MKCSKRKKNWVIPSYSLLQWKLDLVEKLVTAKFSSKSTFCRTKEQQIGRRNFLNCQLNRIFLLNQCELNRCTTVYCPTNPFISFSQKYAQICLFLWAKSSYEVVTGKSISAWVSIPQIEDEGSVWHQDNENPNSDTKTFQRHVLGTLLLHSRLCIADTFGRIFYPYPTLALNRYTHNQLSSFFV